MRIVGGDWRGRALTPVGKGAPGLALRPTPDRVRESLFNLLAHGGYGDPVPGAIVLDLFAGTGALGLEALSRGASAAVFVENGRKPGQLLAENVRLLGAGTRARHLKRDATKLASNDGPPATLVFLDPPYGKGLGARALASALEGGWLVPDALVVWEEEAPQAAPEGFRLIEHRAYGGTHLTLLERDQPQVG